MEEGVNMRYAKMTSCERVHLAIHHCEPDRVPFDMTLTVDVYQRLREYLGLPAEAEKPVSIWGTVSSSLDLLDAMQVDLQEILPFGSPEDVRRHVQEYIRALAPGGGYIVSPAHNVQSDVSPANLVALRDAVEECGIYPIHDKARCPGLRNGSRSELQEEELRLNVK